jgi:RimJ/RimL family protein N-acetyltransferase
MAKHVTVGSIDIRPPTPEDAARIAGLINLTMLLETGMFQMTVERLHQHWNLSGFDLAADARVALGPDGRALGYVEVWDCRPHGTPYISAWVHPDHAGNWLEAQLLGYAEGRALAVCGAGRDVPVRLRTATLSVNHAARRLLSAQGFRLAERIWRKASDSDLSSLLPHWPGDPIWHSVDSRLPLRVDVYEKEVCARA